MATIGYTTIGSNNAATASNWDAEAQAGSSKRYTAVSGDTVTQVAVYGAADGQCSVGITDSRSQVFTLVRTQDTGNDVVLATGSLVT